MNEEDIYCHGEDKKFPDSEFRRAESGALIHKVKKEHYAANGEPVIPGDIPGTEIKKRRMENERSKRSN